MTVKFHELCDLFYTGVYTFICSEIVIHTDRLKKKSRKFKLLKITYLIFSVDFNYVLIFRLNLKLI